MIITGRVHAGRLVVDEPTTLPEGTEVTFLLLDPGDWLDENDRAALHAALEASDNDVATGRLVEAEDVLRDSGRVERAAHLLRIRHSAGRGACV